MKKVLIPSLLSAVALTASAAPLVTIGDQLDVFATGAFIGKYDSNVTYSGANKINDYSGIFRVGAETDYGRNSKFKANVKFFEDIIRYAQHKEFNADLAHVRATASYTETNFSLTGGFGFSQNYQNSTDTTLASNTGRLVRFNSWDANFKGSYDFTEKFYGELGGLWSYTQYNQYWSTIYSDNNIYAVPVSFLYRVTQKISLGLTYQYRYTQFSGGYIGNIQEYGNDRADNFIGATVRGELLPKLSAEIYVGSSFRDYTSQLLGHQADTTLSVSGSLAYQVTEKVNLYMKGSRDFGSGASRQSTIVSQGEFGVNYAFSEQVSSVSSFTYMNTEYMTGSRIDNTYMARVGVVYNPNKFISLSANYRYYDNASNLTGASFSQNVVDFTVGVRY